MARWIKITGAVVVVVFGAALAVGSLGSPATYDGFEAGTPSGVIARGSIARGDAPAPEGPGTFASEEGLGGADIGSTILGFDDRIVRTADLTVEVREGAFDAQWNAAFAIAQRFGGRVLTANRSSGDRPVPLAERDRAEGPLFGDVTIRVPAEHFEQASGALRDLGTLRSESVSSEDVTQEFVDLESRLRHQRAEEDVLVALMAQAKSVRDTLAVQSRLSEVQGEIEQITGRLRFLEERSDFSTITVHLAEPGALVLPFEDGSPSFAKAWRTALTGLARMATAAMIAALWLLPFAVLALLGIGVARLRRPAPQA